MAETSSANPSKTSNPPSDTEGGEKPVREQLKKTSIDVATNNPSSEQSKPQETTEQDASTLRRKRSRDDDEDLQNISEGAGRHVRKRSRDNESHSSDIEVATSENATASETKVNGTTRGRSATPPNTSNNSSAIEDAVASPKGKRTRAQFQKDDEHQSSSLGTSTQISGETEAIAVDKIDNISTIDERGAKRPRELGEKPEPSQAGGEAEEIKTKLATASGFGNASTASPFASLSSKSALSTSQDEAVGAQKANDKESKASSSPFGTLGQASASSSPFATLSGQQKSFGDTGTKTQSAFGGLSAGQSGFGSIGARAGTSGFGGLGSTSSSSPFASALGGKSAFGGFAPATSSGNKPPILGLSGKPAKPFGAPQSDEEREESEDDADATDVSKDIEQGISSPNNEPKRDKRFVEQEVETGEENERTLFSSRAKLYYFDGIEKSWKERGVGTFKCNITRGSLATNTVPDESEASSAERKARFIMRAEGSHRLLLNSPLSQQTKFGDANGQCPKSTTVLWHGVLEGHDKPVGLQLKMKADLITSLWEVVHDAKAELS